MTKTVSLLVGIALIIGVGGFVYWQNAEMGTNSAAESGSPTQSGGITAAEVAEHTGATSCWSSINGTVYDLTSWIPNHPGGQQAILQLCGKDGSEKFNGVHGGMATQEQILAGFKIGTLSP